MGGLRRLRVATQVESTVIGTVTFPRIGPVNRVAKRPASARRAGSEPSRGNTSPRGRLSPPMAKAPTFTQHRVKACQDAQATHGNIPTIFCLVVVVV